MWSCHGSDRTKGTRFLVITRKRPHQRDSSVSGHDSEAIAPKGGTRPCVVMTHRAPPPLDVDVDFDVERSAAVDRVDGAIARAIVDARR